MNMIVPAPLSGEVLSASDDVRVIARLHPFRQERVEHHFPAGSTLDEIAERIAAEPGCRFASTAFQIRIDGHEIAPEFWRLIRPKPRAIVTLWPVPEGFLAPIIGVLGSAFAAGGFFTTFIGKLLLTGISLAAKFLLNKLFAPRPQKQIAAKPSFSFSGSRNTASPNEPVPSILGKHRVVPLYGGLPYTESVGEDQYLRILFVWGYGPLLVEDIKIGETPLSSFEDVQIETRNGYVGDAPVTLYPRQTVEEPLSIDLKNADGWHRRTTAENVNEISNDFVFPNGVQGTDNKGRHQYYTVVVSSRYRRVGTAPWASMPDVVVTANTQDTIRRNSLVAGLPAGQYEVETWKASGDFPGDPNYQVVEAVAWTALRGFRNAPPLAFPKPLCISAIRIKATSQLNGTLDTLNGICTSLVTAWNGSSWAANQPSRNCADLYRHILQGPANARPVATSRIDLATLQAFHAHCVAKGWTFDMPRLTKESVFDTLTDVCAAARASHVFKDGKWSVIWDEADIPVVQMFTPRNSRNFQASKNIPDKVHAWRARFVNAAKGYVEDERPIYDDGYNATNATLFEGIEFPGVTNTDNVWKLGRYHIAQIRLRPETFTLEVDFEHLICTRGDRVRVAHDVPLVGLGWGRVVSVNAGAQTITVDEIMTLGGGAYQMRFRQNDGTVTLTRNIAIGTAGELKTVPLDGIGGLPSPGDLFSWGEIGRETGVYRVLDIDPGDDLAAKLTLVDDAPEILNADTGAIPQYDSNVTAPIDPFSLPPTDVRLTANAVQVGNEYLATVNVSWLLPRLGRVARSEVEYKNSQETSWRRAGAAPSLQNTLKIDELRAGNYSFRVRAIFDDGTFSRWATTESIALDVLLAPPDDVLEFRINTLGDQSTLAWKPVGSVGATYEIRFAPPSVVSPIWNTATPLVPSVSGTSTQVPTMIGTYLIKAVLPTGVKSTNAAQVASNVLTLAGLNVVETLSEAPGFAGTRDRIEMGEDGGLRLASRNVMDNWESFDSVISFDLGDGDDDSLGLETVGYYYFANSLDLGEAYTSRVTAEIDAQGEDPFNTWDSWSSLDAVPAFDGADPADWQVQLEVRTTLSDPVLADWTSVWQPFVVGDVTARAFEFRIKLEGKRAPGSSIDYAVITPVVYGLTVTIDMPDRVVAGEDIVVPAAGLTIPFNPPFRGLHGIATADQDLVSGDRKAITSKSETGFTIRFYTSAGTPVQRTIDFVAKGYGSVHT